MGPSEGLAAALEVSPLTVLVQGALGWAFPPDAFGPLFAEHGGGQYDRDLTLRSLFWLLVSVVSGGRRSAFAAFTADQASDRPAIPTSHQALHGKVGRTCPQLGPAPLRHSADRLLPLLRAAGAAGWHGHPVRAWDGTDLGGSERRPKVLRRTRPAGPPGRPLVEYDRASGLCTGAAASEGACACEIRLVLPLVRQALKASHRVELEGLSGHCLADELAGNHRAAEALLKAKARAALAGLEVPAFWGWCPQVAGKARPRAFEKRPRGEERPQPKPAGGKRKPHYSTFSTAQRGQETMLNGLETPSPHSKGSDFRTALGPVALSA